MSENALKILIGLHKNANAIDLKTGRLAKKHGLSMSQFMVLETLYSKGDQTVGQVRERILSSVGTIPVVIKNLERMGLVARRSDEKDRRICILSLTEAGRELICSVIPENTQMIMDYMSVLSPEEEEELLTLLKKIGGRI